MRGCRPLRPEEVVAVTQSFGGRYQWRDRALFLVGLYTGFCITDLLGRAGTTVSGTAKWRRP
jgi:hypothetical protein